MDLDHLVELYYAFKVFLFVGIFFRIVFRIMIFYVSNVFNWFLDIAFAVEILRLLIIYFLLVLWLWLYEIFYLLYMVFFFRLALLRFICFMIARNIILLSMCLLCFSIIWFSYNKLLHDFFQILIHQIFVLIGRSIRKAGSI